MTVRDIIVEGVETAGPDATVEALALRLAEAGVGSIVIEEDMEPVGIVTDRDVAVRVDAGDRDASDLTAADIMTVDPVTMPQDANLLAVTATMRDHAIRRMPIVDETGTLVGVVTLDDVVTRLSEELANLASVVRAETPPQ